MFSHHNVDMMICDIEMPQGNGLELLRWVREHYPATGALFLTCHAEFDYAKQAMQLGSLDYLLKPVRYEELEATIDKALQDIVAEREKQKFTETLQHYYELWSMHHPLLIERFWLDLVRQSVPSDKEQIRQMMIKMQIPYDTSMSFIPIVIAVQEWHKPLSAREIKIMEYALNNAMEHTLKSKELQGQVIQLNEGILLVVLPVFSAEDQNPLPAVDACHHFILSCNQYFYCDLSCYIGEAVSVDEVRHMVEALIQMDADNVTLVNQVLQLHERAETHRMVDIRDLEHWLEWLKLGNKSELLAAIERYMETLKRDGCDARMLQEFYQVFLQMIHHTLQLKGLLANRIFSDSLSLERAQTAARSVSHLRDWACYVAETAIDHIRSAQESHTVVDRVKRFIAEHIDQDLSRDDIAEHVFLNPDYLTRIFKKETGVSVSDYLLEARFNYAKQLLVQTDEPVSVIAATIGYTNFSHFSKMFKRVSGLNPQDYRKQYQQIWSEKK
ncbi:helix-turn-helix domain-containing protein [Paenibacillus konkukensis]